MIHKKNYRQLITQQNTYCQIESIKNKSKVTKQQNKTTKNQQKRVLISQTTK